MKFENLRLPKGARRRKKRVGRGIGSGHGKTSTRGHKGQKARAGRDIPPWFEGGQMPLYRRIPKRGFSNAPFKKEYEIVNVATLDKYFENGEEVNVETLLAKGVIKRVGKDGIKILGKGELTKKLKVVANKFSKQAEEKIKKAGGEVVVL